MASESCLETEAEEENVKEEEDGNEQGVEDLKNLEVQETEEKRVSVATEHEDSPEAIKEELLNNVFAAFRFSKKYHIELEPYSTKQIEVTFCPQYKGLHCDLYNLQFEGCSNCFEQTIMLTGDIEKVPLRFEPTVIDLQTCIMDSGVYQRVFKVYNDSSKTFPVIAKIPKCMKNFCQIYPREPVVQSLGFCIFSLKFYPSSSLKREARSFYCPETQILEFPIYIRPNTSYSCKSFASCKPDYLKIYVLALITDYALELNPAQINFGTVTTLETVKKEISLTNHSLSMQEYGFLNLPKGVRVEPNMGFGKIFPKETITLFVLYSPVLEHVEGNDAGLQGIEGRHNFRISVTSVAELGRMKKSSYGSNQDTASEIETSFLGESDGIESLTPEDKFLPPEAKPKEHTGPIREIIEMVPENTEQNLTLKIQEKEEKIREFLKRDDGTSECSFSKAVGQSNSTKPEAGIGKANSSEEVFLEEENSIILTDSSEKISSIQCTALVIDPYCELSSTIIQLPATPCTSFSITKFQIIGANFSTATKCYCGFNDKNQKSFSNKSLQFEFQYDFPQIRIEPRSGYFKIGENVPIWIIFRPEIPADKIEQESKMQKSAQILEELNKEKEKEPSAISIPKPVKGKKGKEKKKKESETPKPQTIEDVANSPLCQLNESDLFNAEKSLLQTMEPFHSEIKISCIIKTDDQTRSESHDMIIISPVIKPDFVYLGNSQKITFGKVPIGSKATFLIKIQNIKMKKISPALSILNPFGPFYYPIGKVQVDPEHVWVVPITFTPFEEKDYIEFFEIRSDKTILLMKTTGEGIEAKFSMVPNFSVVRVDTKPGGSAEFKFNFENSCGGNLSLKIMKEFTKAKGESRASLDKGKRKPQTSGEIRPSVDKGKIKPQTIETEITEEISQEIESAYTELPENEDLIFTLLELNEELLIPPYAKADIKIQFTPPPGEENKSYVTKFKIMLGKWKILKEFLIFGTVTKRK